MRVESIERLLRRFTAFGGLALTVMAVLGLVRGSARPKGLVVGRPYSKVPFPFYVVVSVVYVVLCVVLWRPVPIHLSRPGRLVALVVGFGAYVVGLGLIFWGRIALGDMYNVSASTGVELYERHRLITSGPFAIVRHPMYLGALVAGIGAALIYRTWSVVLMLAHFPVFVVRAQREEEALAAEFGEEWQAYRRRVRAWLPRVGPFGSAI